MSNPLLHGLFSLVSDEKPTHTPSLKNHEVIHETDIEVQQSFDSRADLLLGYLIIGSFFGVLLFWGLLAQLSSAAIAPGEVYVEGHRKQVQHEDGGTVKELLVHEGDRVKKGQALVLLKDLRAKTDYNTIHSQLVLALARQARLSSDYRSDDQVEFPEWLLQQASLPDVSEAMRTQENIFDSDRELIAKQEQILTHQIAQSKDQIAGERRRLRGLKKKAALNEAQLTTYQGLLEEGLVTQTKLYTLESNLAGLRADIGEAQANLAANQQEVSQLRARISELKKSRQQQLSQDLDELNERVITLTQNLKAAESRLKNTTVRAPISGVVVNQTIHTTGGVISPGATILEIVPSGGKLIIETRIDPKDRDTVAVGQNAEVRFSAFNQRTSRPVKGKVTMISADRLADAKTGKAYYRGVVELQEAPDIVLNGAEIHPGMQAEVMIVTGERSAIDYLTAPFARSLNRAFRED
ncbi:MAG: HlyD family type I secretion periplasmic adaptor subunit [bacterium]